MLQQRHHLYQGKSQKLLLLILLKDSTEFISLCFCWFLMSQVSAKLPLFFKNKLTNLKSYKTPLPTQIKIIYTWISSTGFQGEQKEIEHREWAYNIIVSYSLRHNIIYQLMCWYFWCKIIYLVSTSLAWDSSP